MGSIMIQGTGRGVGKTTISAALCRILRQDGRMAMPFKPQAFSETSYITNDSCEIGRSIVLQALACKQPPNVLMNPVLVKPTVNKQYQVLVMGKHFGTMPLSEYYQSTPALLDMVVNAYQLLTTRSEDVIVCGMGNPSDPFLTDTDLANMPFAEKADIPVILVADCLHGGATAAINGTLQLLGERKNRICGVILNKFYGDKKILDSIKNSIPLPVLGVIPETKFILEQEDFPNEDISVEIIKLPNMSAKADLLALEDRGDVEVRYISSPQQSKEPDLLILPDCNDVGKSQNFLRESGFDVLIRRLAIESKLIIGIGNSYPLMGTGIGELSLIDMQTVVSSEAVKRDVWVELGDNPSPYFSGLDYIKIHGHEQHKHKTKLGYAARPAMGESGAFSAAGNVFGTYVHGLFDNEPFLDGLLENLKSIKGINYAGAKMTPERQQELAIDGLADFIRDHIDIEKIYQIMGDAYSIETNNA